ncbi:hypothetical protein [Niallia sp. MER 6]|uniref:hypothetical protein n=1 Tax=Niallia sp. MER 6 TaxID=2939567 RepID=UPI00204078EC|nr:hypothetical protein [Niallia sp. MER 6]MCM3033912.1 hypothetical protein [Niallia sp. MER 6]
MGRYVNLMNSIWFDEKPTMEKQGWVSIWLGYNNDQDSIREYVDLTSSSRRLNIYCNSTSMQYRTGNLHLVIQMF